MQSTILLLLFGDIGDTILTVPAIRAIRARYPAARLILLGKPVPGSIIRRVGLVDEVIEIDKHAFDRPRDLLRPATLLSLARLWFRLKRERIDTVVLFHHLVTRWGTVKFALLALGSGARHRIGIDNGRGWFLTKAVRDEGFGARHEAEYYLEVARLLDAEGPLRLEFPIEPRDRAQAEALGVQHGLQGRAFFVVHAGSGAYGAGRKWPAERFAVAAASLAARTGMVPVLVGTEVDRPETAEVLQSIEIPVVDLTGKTDLGELAALVQRAGVVIANDAGVGHLAAAVGTPVVTIFGPSNDRAWRPLGGTVVAADLACRPCFYRDLGRGLPAGCATRECLFQVTPEAVVLAAERALEGRELAG